MAVGIKNDAVESKLSLQQVHYTISFQHLHENTIANNFTTRSVSIANNFTTSSVSIANNFTTSSVSIANNFTTSSVSIANNFPTSSVNIVKNISWCHDLQGSDFIYTPTLYSPTVRHVIAVAFILVMMVTVIGNAIVIIIVVTDRSLRRITSSLVLSMATADILVAMCGELQSIIMMLSTDAWALSDVLCEIFTSADLYFSLSGLLHIVSLAGDRYLAICYPFKYERWYKKYMVLSIVTSWTLPLGFSFLPIMGHWYKIGLEDLYACLHGLEIHICTLFPNKGFSTISFAAMFALPSGLMCYCYAHIYRVAKAQRRRMRPLTLGVYCDVNDPCILVTRPMIKEASSPAKANDNSSQFYANGTYSPVHRLPRLEYDETLFIQNINLQPDTNGNTERIQNGLRVERRQGLTRKSCSNSKQKLGFLGEDFRAARVISIVFLCFTITWSPYWFTILIMPYLGPNQIPDPIIGAGLWLAYFGSALNPFVYYFSNTAVKKGIRRLITKVLHRLGHHNHTRSNSFP